MHVEHDAVGMARGRSDKQMFHQPAVLRGAGLESRHGAKIDQLGIDRLAALEPLHEFDGAEADALVLDIDHGAVVGLERVFGFEFDQFVGADDLKIGAESTDLAVDIGAAHIAADHRDNSPDAMTDIAGRRHTADMSGNGENIFGRKLRYHHYCPIMCCGNQVASNGNAIRIISRTISVATNGITPLKIVVNDTSLTTLLITKTFIPTGGWIRPSSTVITMITPNQIGSKPR